MRVNYLLFLIKLRLGMKNNDSLKDTDNYLKSLYDRLKSTEEKDEQELLNEIENVLKEIDKLRRNGVLRRVLRLFGIIALIAGLMVLGWDHIYIHVVYMSRLIVIMVLLRFVDQ